MGRLKSAAVYTSVFVVCVFAVVLADKFLNVSQCALNDSISVVRKVYVDTITYYKPVPKDSVVVRYFSVMLPVDSKSENCSTDSARIINNEVSKTDSVRVVVPVTQTIYEDSAYRAYISGYHARLDSIFVFPHREITTIEMSKKEKRWNVGLQAGYGITPKGTLPYFGFGVSLKIW